MYIPGDHFKKQIIEFVSLNVLCSTFRHHSLSYVNQLVETQNIQSACTLENNIGNLFN